MKNKIKPHQILVITVSGIIGVDILMFQQKMVAIAGHDAWIALGLGGILLLLAAIPLIYILKQYPYMDLPDILLEVGGKWIGRILLIPILIYILMYAGLSTRIFAQALKMFLIDKTPIWVVLGIMIIVVVYLVSRGIYTMASVLDIIFPISFITIILLILLVLPEGRPINLKPIMFQNTLNVMKAIIPGYYHFTGYGMIAYILPHSDANKKALKAYGVGLIIPLILYIVLMVVSIMVLSIPNIEILIYPTLGLSKTIEFKTNTINRLESFIAVIWIVTIFASVSIFTFASVRNISAFFSVSAQYEKYIAYVHTILLMVVALWANNALKAIRIFEIIKYIDVAISLVFIPLLALYMYIKSKREE